MDLGRISSGTRAQISYLARRCMRSHSTHYREQNCVRAHETAFRNADDLMDPRVSVLLNKSFDGLPPCLLIVCELDPVRDDSYAYQEALDKAGVKTKLTLIRGIIHPFFSFPGIYRNACGQMINAVQEFMASL
ncbi:unnamed protein product [Adineta steineri]|uniref:Alpha/beta hydrolase fold-3 domain-containing protein n=2 Tax=Adineta steineri TaxID=433720 RepID=A0A820ASU0_9BILA|nr:unnamed protein product [Adineta steineri]CAF4190255.1 unnamed protein product [Adineta steineri]